MSRMNESKEATFEIMNPQKSIKHEMFIHRVIQHLVKMSTKYRLLKTDQSIT